MSYFNKLSQLLFFLIFTNFCFSQKVFIIDADNGNKIVNATVFSKQNLKSVISNINGEVDLSSFSSNDSLVFGHISYKNLITQKKSIKGSIVSLQPAAHALNEVVLSVARSKESKEKITVKCKKLIDIVNEEKLNHITNLKIDIEGSEDLVLIPFFKNCKKKLYPKNIVLEHSSHKLWKKNLIKFFLIGVWEILIKFFKLLKIIPIKKGLNVLKIFFSKKNLITQ